MSAENETLRFGGGESELQEATEPSEQLLVAIDMMLSSIRAEEHVSDERLAAIASLIAAGDPDITRDKLRERMDDVRIHLNQCREEWADAMAKRPNVEVGYDQVRQASYKAPRSLKFFARYRNASDQIVTYECAPRDVAIHKIPYQLRNLIQRCAIG